MSDDEGTSKRAVQGARPEVKVADDAGTIGTRAKEVDSLIARQQFKDAVMCAIKDPPIGSKNQDAKDTNYRTVLKALNAVKEVDIRPVVDQIHKTQGELGTDVLMKYALRGLADADSCGTLLKFHAAIVDVAGLGPIVRAMTDRKTV